MVIAPGARAVRAPAVRKTPRPGLIQRCGGIDCPPGTCGHTDALADATVPRAGDTAAAMRSAAAPAVAHDVIRSAGVPLDAATREAMEPRFGYSFSDVRVHADERAAKSAAAVGALAYTAGNHVVFGAGRYAPDLGEGRRLIAHELAHVVQQSCSDLAAARPTLAVGPADTPEEREADAAADAALRGGDFGPVPIGIGKPLEVSRRTVSVQRKCVGDSNGVKHWKYEYDGCSLPAQFSLTLGGQTFGGASKDNPAGGDNTAFSLMKPTTEGGVACDRHDECYQSCTTTKGQCDDRMYSDMKETCAKASPYFKQRCYSAALLYYQGLKQLPQAQKAFDDRKNQVCSCDPKSRPPAERFPPPELLRSPRGGYLSWLDYQLSLTKLIGYKVFRDPEQYEGYLHGGTGAGGSAGQTTPRAP
jgi:hypothetical protein